MYGVVIWSDQSTNRAVIWCEDHGDLAYFKGDVMGTEASAISPGDLVEFDLTSSDERRLADAPRLIARKTHPSLVKDLKRAGSLSDAPPPTRKRRPEMAQGREADVVYFDRARCAGAA